MPHSFKLLIALLLLCVGSTQTGRLKAEQVTVRRTEGTLHGFLALRTLQGAMLAAGDLTQTATRDHVTTKLVFRFKDGSIHEETTEFSQRGKFQVTKYHLIQKGPAFKRPMEISMDAASGETIVRYRDDEGEEKVLAESLEIPADIANGITSTLLTNIDPTLPKTTVSMLAATPKPRIVNLEITPHGESLVSIGGFSRAATHYVVKIDIKGVAGILAPLLGKQPPDTHVWILRGEVPAFLRSEGPLFESGPIWRIELLSPVWPREGINRSSR